MSPLHVLLSPSRRAAVARAVTVALVGASLVVAAAPTARADSTTVSHDSLRTAWDPNEPGLAPAAVSSSDFGQLFATQLDGQIYAQPVVGDGTVLAVTENDKAYGLDAVTGAVKWSRDMGPFWPASAIGCGDLVPNVGMTATPVLDPNTHTAYFTAKVADGPDLDHPTWYMHAVDIRTGAERNGFPRAIAGAATNDPTHPFNAKTAMQRPGLLLMNGVVYAGFASHCDYAPYVGYIVGVNASTGVQTSMWATQSLSRASGAGIWQSGGGLVSDGSGRIFFATGNGVSPTAGPGSRPPASLGESVVRVDVAADGTMKAGDFFSPVNNTNLDRDDADLGSGGPMALPDGFGTTAHPHLMVQVGKDGRVYLLDRDDLGGNAQGAGATDDVLQTAGPYNGVWGSPAFYGGSGGYVYTIENNGYLRAYKVGVSGAGLPSLTSVGTSVSTWGYTSGSPAVTSSGTTAGSALVWGVYASGANGSNGQLRAYDAVPVNGVMNLRYSAPIGTATKFAKVATDNGRAYVGTRDGKVFGFGRPAAGVLTASPTDFGSVAVGAKATKTVTVTATQAATVTAVSASAPFGAAATGLPAAVAAGGTFSVPVTYTPTAAGSASGALTFTVRTASGATGTVAFDLHGTGTQPGLGASPPTLAFGSVPTTGRVTLNVNIANTGTATTTVRSATGPTAPFSTTALPTAGATLAPGAALSVPVTFAPSAAGSFSSALTVTSNTGTVSVPITGTGVAGASRLTLTPTTVDFGTVPVGATASSSFQIANTGNLLLTLTKAAPPTAPFGTTQPVSEGQQLAPGDTIEQPLTFSPTAAGAFTGTYLITGDDGRGAQPVTVKGTGVVADSVPVPSPAAGGWRVNGSAHQTGGDTVLTDAVANQAGSVVYPTPVRTDGLHVTFTAQLSGGSGGDGMTFTLLDPAQAGPTALGKAGGALGYGSLPGLAVTLDTFQNAADPSGNFIGIALGAKGAASDALTYLATAPAPTSLRSGTHVVDVALSSTGIAVRLDGGAPLTATGAVPAHALLAFTAGTGAVTDTHLVRGVTITQPVAVGPVGAVGGTCLDVVGAGTGDGVATQVTTCNGTAAQRWTVASNGTLKALGACLDVAGGSTAPGAAVRMWTCNGTPAQVWAAGAGSTLRNSASGLCLDTRGGVTTPGTTLVTAKCGTTPSQMWKLPG
ncbi:choice-of-anchor D domain-containing protein [Jatrophihabitans sp. YIM 134969]